MCFSLLLYLIFLLSCAVLSAHKNTKQLNSIALLHSHSVQNHSHRYTLSTPNCQLHRTYSHNHSTYFINIIFHAICRHVYKLLSYEILRTYVHRSFGIRKAKQTKISTSAILILQYLNYIYVINFYISPESRSPQHIFCKIYSSHIRSSHAFLFVITKCLQLKPKSFWCPPRSSQCSHRIVTISHMV